MRKKRTSINPPTAQPLWEKTSVPRLYKRVGTVKVSFIYKHVGGSNETLASANIGERAEIRKAELKASRLALDIQAGTIVAESTAEMINRFIEDVAPEHYADQSKHGKYTREKQAQNLIRFFGKMAPTSLKTIHGYQYLDDRAKSGAPALANKEMALMNTICHYAIRWGLIEVHPFLNLKQNKVDRVQRYVTRSQVVRFYLWAVKQESRSFKTMGIAAMFCYLTGFRAAEIRPFMRSGLSKKGVFVQSAKRHKGNDNVHKMRNLSMKLRCVVSRANSLQDDVASLYLFPARSGQCFSKSGWATSWIKAMRVYLGTEEATNHPEYFSLSNIRPVAISKKMEKRSADVYDFAAHATPATTHKHYDRRRVKIADATE